MQSSLSSDGSLAAIVSPAATSRLMIQVYQLSSSSCSLNMTLTHTSPNPLKDLAFCGNTMVVGLLGTSEIIVWDLERGVVANKMMSSSEDQNFLALSGDSEGSKFSILTQHSQKLYVYEYLAANSKLTRKVKSGRFEGDRKDAFLALSKKHIVVQTSGGARVMNRVTGKKEGKVKSKNFARIFICPTDENLLVGVQNSGSVTVYNLSTMKKVVNVPQIFSSATSSLQMIKNKDGSHTLLADHTLHKITGSSAEKLTQATSARPIAMFLIRDQLLALIHQPTGGCSAEWVALEGGDLPSTIKVDEKKESKTESKSATKRKASSEAKILGPGQAGMEIVPPSKKAKPSSTDEDENVMTEEDELKEMSIGERLQQMSRAMEEEDEEDDDDDDDTQATSFKPKTATTESLKQLLSQALQAGDDNLLELALGVRDVQVISTTMKELEPAHIVLLVSKLTSRLASTPMRAEQLSTWLSYCLKTGRFQPQNLSALRNLLFERIESFSDLLRLEGRLSMMCDIE
ncbi:MAG: hypothetical protein SGBAC_004119 [Bacillariaceae sp.]